MSTLFILTVLFCSINSIWTTTPTKDCGSELGIVKDFQVTGCDAAPCKFVKGNTYAMNLTFVAKAPSTSATVSIHGIIAGVPVPFPLPVTDACKMGVKCPIGANDANMATMAIPVEASYPSISLYVKIEIKADDQKQDYACLEFPATITSGSAKDQKLVGWKKGKLFEMLH